MSAQKFTAVVAIKSLFLDVMWPGSDQLKGMVLGEKIHYKKKRTVYLVIASSNCWTAHDTFGILLWYGLTKHQDESLRSWRYSLGRDGALGGIAIDRQQGAKRREGRGWNRLPRLFA